MALALLLPERFVPDEVDATGSERIRADVRALLAHVRQTRPADGSLEEGEALVRLATLALGTFCLFGPRFVDVLRSGVDRVLRELIERELATAETERKFALRQIEQAANTFGVLVEGFLAFVALVPMPTQSELAAVIAKAPAEVWALSDDDRALLRFELDLAMALESLEAPLEELTYWASRAIRSARRLQVTQLPGLRGEQARVRSRRSWVQWDAEDLRQELAPWPAASR